jgi:CubicO group peptidase (beta-lactamase class C family)
MCRPQPRRASTRTSSRASTSTPRLGLILSRACGESLRAVEEELLLDPLGIEVGEWWKDADGNHFGCCGMSVRSRDLAKLGQLYLDGGKWNGKQLLPAAWVRDSLAERSSDVWKYAVGKNFQDVGYGYQWWRIRAGEHDYNLAWGHGGQQIAIVHDLDLVVVVTAYPMIREHGPKWWRRERGLLSLVADFVAAQPVE